MQAGVDLVELLLVLHLNAQMVEAGFAPSKWRSSREDRRASISRNLSSAQWLGSEQGRIDAYGLREVADGDMHVKALHGVSFQAGILVRFRAANLALVAWRPVDQTEWRCRPP